MARDDDELSDWLTNLAGPGVAPAGPREPAPPTDSTVPPADGMLDGGAVASAGPADDADWPPADTDRVSPGRAWRLWALACVPWVVIAAVAVVAWAGRGGSDAGVDAEAPDSGRPVSAAAPTPAGDGGDDVPADGDAGQGAGDAVGGDALGGSDAVPSEMAHRAEAAVRRAGAARLAEVDGVPVHVDHTRAVAASELGDGALVTVAALVRRAADRSWSGLEPARFAVSLDVDGRLREPPWLVPAHVAAEGTPAPAALDALDPEDEPDLAEAAVAALAAAGYTDPELTGLHHVADGVAVRAEALARAPGSATRGAHTVWLDADAGAVLGHHPRPDHDDDRSSR